MSDSLPISDLMPLLQGQTPATPGAGAQPAGDFRRVLADRLAAAADPRAATPGLVVQPAPGGSPLPATGMVLPPPAMPEPVLTPMLRAGTEPQELPVQPAETLPDGAPAPSMPLLSMATPSAAATPVPVPAKAEAPATVDPRNHPFIDTELPATPPGAEPAKPAPVAPEGNRTAPAWTTTGTDTAGPEVEAEAASLRSPGAGAGGEAGADTRGAGAGRDGMPAAPVAQAANPAAADGEPGEFHGLLRDAAGASRTPGERAPLPMPESLARIEQSVGHREWGRAMGQRVAWMAENGVQQARIKLNPDNLGPVDVRVTVEDGQANVWFGAQHASTREALEAAMPRLRDMLGEQGLRFGESSVSDQGTGRDAPGQAAPADGPWRDAVVESQGAGAAVEPTDSAPKRRLLDAYA